MGLKQDHVEVGGDLVTIDVKELLEGVRHPSGLDVFISYAHQDAQSLDDFKRMLSPVIREGRIQSWSDREISPSQNWRIEIDRAMKMSKSGLLLVSQAFLDSDFIMKEELPYLLKARKERGARLFIAILDSCLREETPLKEIQAAHDASQPLYEIAKKNRNSVIKSICQELIQETARR